MTLQGSPLAREIDDRAKAPLRSLTPLAFANPRGRRPDQRHPSGLRRRRPRCLAFEKIVFFSQIVDLRQIVGVNPIERFA